MAYWLSQIFGVLGLIFIFVSMQTKNMKLVLLCQIGCNGLGMLSYVLLGGFSGCGIYLIATMQSVVFYILRKMEREEPRWLQPALLAAYVGCSALSFQGLPDLAPLAGAVFFSLGVSQKRPSVYRICMLLNGVVWMIYDVVMGAHSMLASHIFTTVVALVSIIRLDILKKTEKV